MSKVRKNKVEKEVHEDHEVAPKKTKGKRPEQKIFIDYFGEKEDSLSIHKVEDIIGIAVSVGDESLECAIDDIKDRSTLEKLAIVGLKNMLTTSARLAMKDGDAAAIKAVQKRFSAVCNGKLVARSRASTFNPAPYLDAIEAAYKVAKEELPESVLEKVESRLTTLGAKERDAYIRNKIFSNKLVESEFYKAQSAAAKKESDNSMADFDAD
jgi:hypothetical protein